MIKKIVLRDIASYDHNGVTFADLQKVNFIYGGNGTGKTTLSRVLENRSKYLQCEIKWEKWTKEIVVYNQDFKKKNLTEVMPGVFTFGDNTYSRYLKRSRTYHKLRLLEKQGYDTTKIRETGIFDGIDFEDETRPYSVEPSIFDINRRLERIGFTGFRIKPSRNPYSYEIVRDNGSSASQTLSEGEVTIITFLYFMQMVEGVGKSINPDVKKVVVIDDPISSLDYAAIDALTELTNDLIKKVINGNGKAEQVLVLTHNTAYHQSLSMLQKNENTHYWKLYKKKGVSKAMDSGTVNPVMGDYEELWVKLREAELNTNSIVMPNLMRRIVETYFVDYGKYDKDKLFAGVYAESREDKMALESLAKWFDEGSHAVKDNLYAGNEERICEQCMDAFRTLFEKMGQLEHYNMMMRETYD